MSQPAERDYPHVDYDAKGAPIVAGTTMKVIEIVMAQRAHGWSPEELSFQFPHLSMGQVHAALAYYWDHQAALDAEIDRRSSTAESLNASAKQSPLAQRMAALKHRR